MRERLLAYGGTLTAGRRPTGGYQLVAPPPCGRPNVYAALSAGASGFLLKDVSPEQQVAAVRLVRAGAPCSRRRTRRLIERYAVREEDVVRHREPSTLTARELEVMRLLARA